MRTMRRTSWLLLWSGFLAGTLPAATIGFQVSDVGQNLHRFTFLASNIAFQANQELDIRFDPAQFGTLSNAVVGSGFSLLLFQPNNPPGAFGDFGGLALVDNPSLAGPFSVDFTFLGPGAPGAQPFFINQFDRNGNFVATIESGFTKLDAGSTAVAPEPSSFLLGGMGLLLGGAWWSVKRRSSRTAE